MRVYHLNHFYNDFVKFGNTTFLSAAPYKEINIFEEIIQKVFINEKSLNEGELGGH